jgi:hypothetical protein
MSSDDDGGQTRYGASSTVGWTPWQVTSYQFPPIASFTGVESPDHGLHQEVVRTLPPLNEPKGELRTHTRLLLIYFFSI